MKVAPGSWWQDGGAWSWGFAGALALIAMALVGMLMLLALRGLAHFWPAPLYQMELRSGEVVLGRMANAETLNTARYTEATGRTLPAAVESVERWLLHTANRRTRAPDFRWVYLHEVAAQSLPRDVMVVERTEWGPAQGTLFRVETEGAVLAGQAAEDLLARRLEANDALRERLHEIDVQRLPELTVARSAAAAAEPQARVDDAITELLAERRRLIAALNEGSLVLRTSDGGTLSVGLGDARRAWHPNRMSFLAKLAHFFESIGRFLSEDPREANTEGGVYPAIFGTVLMVMLMSLFVTPAGVVAAVYLQEYARQGPLVRTIRIAVNNLAGVPSIVYGVFGLGFFVYFVGGSLDRALFADTLPSPTFGTPGLLWAALTLALLTLPVVIVTTEEGLARIPRDVRESAMALGATRAETLYRVLLPAVSPAILTGVILAVSRAAGEVAPLMLVGVVKLAPALPLDGVFPFLHLDRKFMHLGFHIYDVGFQSPNVDASRPLVFATALLLVTIVVGLNSVAVLLRRRLQLRFGV